MQMGRRAAWLASAVLAAACGDASPGRDGDAAAGDAAPSTAGACLGTADGMAHIAGGLVTLGCPAGDERCDEPAPAGHHWVALPATEIELADFAIDVVEVPGGELRAWADAEGVSVGGDPAEPEDWPARSLSHEVAAAYCASLGKRLPHWYEWQLAAQGGELRTHPWGEEEPSCQRAQHEGCGAGPAAVGGRGLSPCGVSDLAGNVAEYLAGGDELPHIGDSSSYYFLGGSYLSPAAGLRSYLYQGDEDTPFLGAPFVGFRCAADL